MLSSIVQCKFCASSHRLIAMNFCFVIPLADLSTARKIIQTDIIEKMYCASYKWSRHSDSLCIKFAHNWQFVFLIGMFIHTINVCNGHGRLIEPPSRSSAFRYGFQTPPNYNGEYDV